MKKNSNDIRTEINSVVAKQKVMNDMIAGESRAFTQSEEDDYTGLEERYNDLQKELDAAERREEIDKRAAELQTSMQSRTKRVPTSQPKARDYQNYSVMRAINGVLNKSLDGFEAEVHEEYRNQGSAKGIQFNGLAVPNWAFEAPHKRAISSGGNADGLVDQYGGFIDALRNKTVIGQMGAQFMTGLSGAQIEMPRLVTGAAAWSAETADATDGAQSFEKPVLSPNRLTSYLDVSKQFIAQTEFSAEAVLTNDMVQSMAIALDAAAINGPGTGNTPLGILGFTSATTVDYAGAPTWGKVVEQESTLAAANGLRQTVYYLASYKTLGAMKTIARDAGSGLFLANGMLNSNTPEQMECNGYRIIGTPHIPDDLGVGNDESAIIMGHFNDLIVGQWGAAAVDLTVDTISKAISGQVRLVVNGYYDVQARHEVSFNLGTGVVVA